MMEEDNNEESSIFEPAQYSEICIIGRDLTEFNVIRFGSFIKRIDLSFNFLKHIQGLSICSESLEELILDNNQLEYLELGAEFSKLHTISLNKNRIWHINSLLKELKTYSPNLRFLSLLGNPLCPDQLTNDIVDESDYPKYRHQILHYCKNIRFLDHRPVTLAELNESKKLKYSNIQLLSTFTPLPSTSRFARSLLAKTAPTLPSSGSAGVRNSAAGVGVKNGIVKPDGTIDKLLALIPEPQLGGTTPAGVVLHHRPASKQGKRSLKYIGKNSEGNRFIKDTDL